MTDERLGHTAGAWLRDTDEPARDPQGIVRAAMTLVPQIRQVHASGIRARLEREVVPVPVVGRAATDHHVRKGGSSMYASLRFAMAAVVLLATGGLLFAVMWPPSTDRAVVPVPATSSTSPQPSASTAPSESPMLTTTDTTSDGEFELTISSPRSTWTVDEPIDVSATFTYVGDRSRSTVRATGGGPVGFWFEQLDGSLTNVDRLVGDTSCGSFTYVRGEPEVVPFRKSGGYDPGSEDPDEVFWRTWLQDPELHLPVGTYRIAAGANYGVSECDETQLGVAITIEVVGASDATAEATDWGPLAVLTDPAGGPGGDAGLGPGTITFGERCVTIEADRAEVPVTLIWAEDTVAWRPENRRVVFTDRQGDTVRVNDGDRVVLAGVTMWPPESGTTEPDQRWSDWLDERWLSPPDPSCPEHLWYVGEIDVRKRATVDAASTAAPTPTPSLDASATLPAEVDASASSPFERLWRPLDPADIPFPYSCGLDLTFTTTDLATAPRPADVSASLASAVEETGRLISDRDVDWYVVKQTDERVLALAPMGRTVDDQFLDRTDEGWDFKTGGSPCTPRAMFGDRSVGRWRLDPTFPAPGPKTRTLHVLGYLGCLGSEKSGKPRVHITDDAALVAIPMRSTVRPNFGDCLAPTKMTVRLPEPLGDRTLYDAGSLPLRGANEKLGIDRINSSGSGG